MSPQLHLGAFDFALRHDGALEIWRLKTIEGVLQPEEWRELARWLNTHAALMQRAELVPA